MEICLTTFVFMESNSMTKYNYMYYQSTNLREDNYRQMVVHIKINDSILTLGLVTTQSKVLLICQCIMGTQSNNYWGTIYYCSLMPYTYLVPIPIPSKQCIPIVFAQPTLLYIGSP